MEVRSGYKLTEVGTIPEDWEVKAIKQFAAVKGGKRLPLGKLVIDKVTPHPYLRVTDMRPGGVDLQGIKYVPEDAFPPIRNYRIFVDDIFISVAGTLGIVGKIPAEIDGANLTENADRITDIGCNRDFLLYFLLSDHIQGIIESERTVGAQPKLALGRIEHFVIPLPPTEDEQRVIAAALSDVDALLGGLDRLIAKKRYLKQAAMQQLLTGKIRLPSFSGEWKVKRLEKICTMKSGEGITAKNIDEVSEYPCYGGNGLRGHTTRFTHDGSYCLIGRVGALCGNLLQVKGRFFASEHAIVVTAFEVVDIGWLTLALGALRLNQRAESSAQPVLTVSKLMPLELFVPETKDEQTAIAAVLSDMDTELAALEARRDKTRALKQAMMQELLTGKTRLI